MLCSTVPINFVNLYTTQQYVDSVIQKHDQFVKEAYKIGGRNFSMLIIGPMDHFLAIKEAIIYRLVELQLVGTIQAISLAQ